MKLLHPYDVKLDWGGIEPDEQEREDGTEEWLKPFRTAVSTGLVNGNVFYKMGPTTSGTVSDQP